MFVAQKKWTLQPYPIDRSDWVLELIQFGESLGEKCFVLLEGKEGDHQRTYCAFGEGWILSRKTFSPPNAAPDPIDHLREFMNKKRPLIKNPFSEQASFDLESGIMGYLDFEWGLKWQKPAASTSTPDYFFRLSPINLVLLPLSQSVVLEVFSEHKETLEHTFSLWDRALDRFLSVNHTSPTHTAKILDPLPDDPSVPQKNPPLWYSNMSREAFLSQVKQIKDYVRAGDVFQAVPSQRFMKNVELDPWKFYQKLRVLNPSPYLFCVFADKETLVGSSPELLISSVGSLLQTRPIAGTRPRGTTPEEDQAQEKELLEDPKERAEHAMLVDLGRNDLGRVSEYGSVKVSQYAEVQRFSHVMHIVSTVEGHLDPAYDSLEALKSVFPAGTLSGAPKVRALEILQELEPEPRGAYGGALGIVRWNGDLDFCITIRTLSIRDHCVQVQTGAGIVFDSVPEKEFEETVHKAQALRKVVDECVSRP